MHRSLNHALRGLFALSLLVPAAMLTTAPVAAAQVAAPPVAVAQVATGTIATTTTCSNDVDTTNGLGLICEITIWNNITTTGGSATVTLRECHGSAGDPSAACTTTTSSLTQPVTAVTQCNGSIHAGGVLRCSISVTNNFVGVGPGATPASVNQCVGTGGGGTPVLFACDPFPANTSGAAITQCNGSANGGGASVTCTATGTMSGAAPVTINQCNDSANGGGSLIVCSASLITRIGAGPNGTAPPTSSSLAGGSTSGSTVPFGLLFSFAVGGLGLAAVLARRRSALS